MDNLEKRIDCDVSVAFRNKLVCKQCNIFPRPDTEIMRCASCKKILCGKCCGRKCPLCQHKSIDPKISTFTKETELMEVLSGLKTHPCINAKNGCLDEIPAKLDGLNAHDQSCVFQKVPCPDCEEVVIFNDLSQHLKQKHVNHSISIYTYLEMDKDTYDTGIFGVYNLQAELINDRKYYKKDDDNVISWDGEDSWLISSDFDKGNALGKASLEKDVQNLHNTTQWELYNFDDDEWEEAGEMLRVKGRLIVCCYNCLKVKQILFLCSHFIYVN